MHFRILAAAAAALAIAGCEADNQATTGETASPAANEALPDGGAARPMESAGLTVLSKEGIGDYLASADGRALYILEGTRQQGGQEALVTCTGPCLGEWPALQSAGAPAASAGVEAGQVGTKAMEGGQQVTYAGWPLHYYEPDRAPGSTSGHGTTDEFGTWRLISPGGEPLPGGNPGKAPS